MERERFLCVCVGKFVCICLYVYALKVISQHKQQWELNAQMSQKKQKILISRINAEGDEACVLM